MPDLDLNRKVKNLAQKTLCAFENCKKKIPLPEVSTCKCQKVYCPDHLPVISHECTFDRLKAHRKNLEKQMHPDEPAKISVSEKQNPSEGAS